MNTILLSALLVTAVFSADVIKAKTNQVKKITTEVVKSDKKEVRSKPKTYPRGNIATH